MMAREAVQGTLKSGGAFLVTLVLLAGCGGSSSSSSSDQTATFKTGFDSVAGQLKQSSEAIGVDQISQLQTLKPPSNLAVTFNTLTGAASRVEADLTAIVAAAATHRSAAAKQASASLVTDILSAKSASTTITDTLGTR